MGSHYFDTDPATPLETRELELTVDERTVPISSASGVFGGQRVDVGTSILIRYGPRPPESGAILDIGCGYGPITIATALRSPDAHVWAIDINRRALAMTRSNAERLELGNVTAVEPDEVPADVVFSAIYSNPPIKVGRGVMFSLMDRWLPRLAPDGHACLVVKRSMGADTLDLRLNEAGWRATRLRSKNGYRIIDVARPQEGSEIRPLLRADESD